MGCLNSTGQFDHWFGNIHFSGPCNRACYFCIGQHMMALDPLNNLAEWPLKNIDVFVGECLRRGVKEVNLTGSNTDPLMYKHLPQLVAYLREKIPGVVVGIRTNGVLIPRKPEEWALFDKGSISITTLDPELYRKTMGMGQPPNIRQLVRDTPFELKANVVLCPETVYTGDWFKTVTKMVDAGIRRINLREPYGQPHLGTPFNRDPDGEHLGMPFYKVGDATVTYWDVHYVEVESVNLYANGRVSETYPITKGHADDGKVEDQTKFNTAGRVREQWVKKAS